MIKLAKLLLTGKFSPGEATLRAAEVAMERALPVYARVASQRQTATTLISASAESGPNIILMRCLGLVPYGERFVATLKGGGFRVQECLFSARGEARRFNGVQDMTAEAIETLIANGNDDIAATMGASQGGIINLLVAAPSNLTGTRRETVIQNLHNFLPPTPSRNIESLNVLAERLEGSRTILIASPVKGGNFTSLGQWGMETLGAKRRDFMSWFHAEYLMGNGKDKLGLYKELGFDPEDVVDGIMIGGAETWGVHRGSVGSVAANASMQGVTRFISRVSLKMTHKEGWDGVVPHKSALLGLGPERELVLAGENHISIMETEAAARAALKLITQERV